MLQTTAGRMKALPGIRNVRYLDGGSGRHAEVTGRSGKVHEVIVYPIPTDQTFLGVRFSQGWNWLVDGELPREIGRPMSLDDAWHRAIRHVAALERMH